MDLESDRGLEFSKSLEITHEMDQSNRDRRYLRE